MGVSPTFSPSILTTGVTKEVALVMKASFAFLASSRPLNLPSLISTAV